MRMVNGEPVSIMDPDSLMSMPGFLKKYTAVHGYCYGMYKMAITILVK